MTDTEKSLLDAVCADPFDDGPRLVAADWYDDNGHGDYAAFIRCQIAHAACFEWRCDCPLVMPEYGRLRDCSAKTEPVREYMMSDELVRRFGPGIPGSFWYVRDFHGCEVTLRRGFPDAATLTLAQFMGGVCGRCDGRGWYDRNPGDGEMSCLDCKGTGTIPSLAATLVDWPLTEVRLSDREPQPNSYGGPVVAWHSDPNESWMPSWIPYHLLRVMAAIVDEDADLDGRTWLTFPTSESAHLALGRAAVDYTRALRGRPAMRWE